MKNQKGITLIALVITIIVLLILAGVSIAMLTGDNGLLSKSQQAVKDNAISGAKDTVTTEVQAMMSEFLEAKYSSTNLNATIPGSSTVKYTDAKAAQAYVVAKLAAKYVSTDNKNIVNGCTVAVDATAKTVTITYDTRKCVGKIQDGGSIEWNAMEPTTTQPAG